MSSAKRFPVVGIGASAGGIPAMEGLFKGLGADPPMAFVVVTHLSPERQSLLHEVIGRYTQMPVTVTEDGQAVEPKHVYVMPENAILSIGGGCFRISRPDPQHWERKPIDVFFSALARDQGEHAVGIVLSGGDSDGTLGVKAIKERGGLTIAQKADGSGPRNPDMPESAISSGMIDLALTAEEMGARLIEFSRSLGARMGEAEQAEADVKNAREPQAAISEILRKQTGHDFSGYKNKTFLRRVGRRMHLVQVDTIEAYVEKLRVDPTEVSLLFRDLLINVTNFFRDELAFEALAAKVVPRLFEGRGASETVRIWVPGCATGEEVYSIAMLVREHLKTLSVQPAVQIFATDIDDAVLTVARAGRYPEALMEGVSAERRQRHFVEEGDTYVVAKAVREMCIFSPHSVIRDPPFSRMDLVSCRNLLIYFGPDVQTQVIPTFHYALRPGGYLFLGSSEGVGQHTDLFSVVDKKNRIFQAREHELRLPRAIAAIAGAGVVGRPPPAQHGKAGNQLRRVVEAQVLERFAPAHVVVSGEGEIVYFSAGTDRYLQVPQGAPNRQLLNMARRGLRLDLRAVLRQAIETGESAACDNVALDEGDDLVQAVNLRVEPLSEPVQGEALYLVLFTPQGPLQSRSDAARQKLQQHEGVVEALERELREARERLQSMVEEYETSLEELKSANEELVSVNEEAQSSNEELEASKEEMQSLNEELTTINAELGSKVESLDRANSDLRNLFESTQIATVFLDRQLVIRNFTPAATEFFNLLPADVGRPLTDLSSYLDYPELKDHIRLVFENGEVREHRIVRQEQGRQYLVRLIPYRDADGGIEGVVATFLDVTSLAEAESHQKVLIDELNHRVKNMLAVVISVAQQTLRGATSKEAFGEALIGRLHAMARAYGTLSRENWKSVSAETLIRQELEPFGLAAVSFEGSHVEVPPQVGLPIGMVIHELATNAAKYGALSEPAGRVSISWEVQPESKTFHMTWRESGGPAVEAPDGDGFGLKLIRGEIEYRLGGSLQAEFRPEGLQLELEFPINP